MIMRLALVAMALAIASPAAAVTYRLDAGITGCVGGDCAASLDPDFFDGKIRIRKRAFTRTETRGVREALFTVAPRYDLYDPEIGPAPLDYSPNWRWMTWKVPIPMEWTVDLARFWIQVDRRYRPTDWFIELRAGPPDYWLTPEVTGYTADWDYWGPGGTLLKVKRNGTLAPMPRAAKAGTVPEIAPVPLPAGLWLLPAAIAGLMRPWRLVRRNRRAAATA